MNGHWQLPALVTRWQGGIGMPHISYRLSTDEDSKTIEIEEPAENNKKAVIVFALPELHVSCNSWIDVLLICSVAVAHKKANGGKPVDDMWCGRRGACRRAED